MSDKVFSFIWEDEQDLDSSLCQQIINKFESDSNKYDGILGGGEVDKSMKNSIDLVISGEDWKDIHNLLSDKLSLLIDRREYLDGVSDISCSGFQIQKTPADAEVGYDWHTDTLISKHPSGKLHERVLTFIWYLNDNYENGGTQFNDYTVTPVTGKCLTFPPGITMVHRGIPPKGGDKYILTGWLWAPLQIYGT
jgi:hypothetical protein